MIGTIIVEPERVRLLLSSNFAIDPSDIVGSSSDELIRCGASRIAMINGKLADRFEARSSILILWLTSYYPNC
jgi:hypothetical protein